MNKCLNCGRCYQDKVKKRYYFHCNEFNVSLITTKPKQLLRICNYDGQQKSDKPTFTGMLRSIFYKQPKVA